MEMTRAEIDAIYDAAGRLVVTPHALTCEGQTNVPADLRPGESLADFLGRHVPGIDSGAWAVSIGGCVVPRAMWGKTFPKHGQLIACRSTVGRSALALVAVAALSYFTLGTGATLGGSLLGINGLAAVGSMGLYAVNMGIFMAGSMLINKVLGPKVPSQRSDAAKQVYSISGQRNSARAYEPIPVLWGEMRVTPDLASQPYAWFEGDDQYLSTILLGGINVHSVADLAIGDTPLASYSDVQVFYNGFPGHANQDVPLFGNADSIAGAKLEWEGANPWVTRTSSPGSVALQVDIEGNLYDTGGKRGMGANTTTITIEFRAVGQGGWTPWVSQWITNENTDVLRYTFTRDVSPGQYEVRARLSEPKWHDAGDVCTFNWTTLKSIQPDVTDYSQWGRIGIKIRASGQLSGGLDTVRATYRAKPMPVWTGTAWATATTRENGLSNPGAILLQTLRGVRDGAGRLQFGFGLEDAQIDIEGLKAFMLHCAANGYTYDRWITGSMSLGEFCQEVALAGMGEFAWTDGSRPTAVFVASGQPLSAVANMANMLKASFSVDYSLSNAADGIEYQYVDRARGFETQTLRVAAPGVTTMLNPARITGAGVTSEAHAAIMARYHLAQSLYQYKTIGYTADIEHLDYRRLSVLSLSHDLTQWGHGGRLVAAQEAGGVVTLTLDTPVPPLSTPHVGLRMPGERDYRVWQVQPLAAESDTLTLIGAWPAGVDLPGVGLDNPAHDTLWCYDFKATPGYRVRVVSMEPEADLKGARIACVPEGPEFWDYVLNGTYTPAPNQSAIPNLAAPSASNLRITERVNVQGDTEWYELSAIWDVAGAFDHAQVWAGRDGSELRMVDGNAQARSTFRIDGDGQWLIEVRPFDANGRPGTAATLLYITTQVNLPPWNPTSFVVQTVAGGLRRFAWGYTSDRPASLAGVQIRYRAGSTPATVADWDAMSPLGDADDVYTAQFETTRPDEGTWTFALRAINTAGVLATSVRSVTATLVAALPDVQAPDLTPPPAPTGVTATALMTTAQVGWDAPTYTEGHGHGHSIISVAKVAQGHVAPAFAASKSVATERASPASIPVELGGATYRLWVQHVSRDGVASLPSEPVDFATGEDVGGLLDVLAGHIGDAQLSANLAETLEWDRQQALITRLGAIAMDGQERLHSTAAIETVQTVLQAADAALAQQVTTVFAAVGENAAALEDEVLARASAVEAEALARQELAATVGENQAAVAQQFSAQAGINGYLSAKYALAVQVGSGDQAVVGGMQITGTSGAEAGPKIGIAFATDAFSIASPDGARKTTPFYVQTSPTTVNGVPIPAGVYMDSANIGNVTALWGRFGTLVADSIQATAISASQLTAGDGVIGGTLKSSNYVAGSSGWTLRPDGVAEFSGAIVRGTVYATAGQIGGINISAGSLYSSPYGSGTGFYLGADGKFSLGDKLTWDGATLNIPGLAIRDAQGNVILAAGTPLSGAYAAFGSGVNVVSNGDYRDGLAGTVPGWRSGGAQHTLGRNNANYFVKGEGTAYIYQPGTSAVGTVFDADIWNGQQGQYFAVTPGKRYEMSAYLNAHRCKGNVIILFCGAADSEQELLIAAGNEIVFGSTINSIGDMRQSGVFATAPAGAVKARLIIRGRCIGQADPFVFFSRVYFGEAGAAQTEFSPWSPGRGISEITASNASAYIQALSVGTLQIANFAVSNYAYVDFTFNSVGSYIDVPVGTLTGGCRLIINIVARMPLNQNDSNYVYVSAGVNGDGNFAGGPGQPFTFFFPRVNAHTNVPVSGADMPLSSSIGMNGPANDVPNSFIRMKCDGGTGVGAVRFFATIAIFKK